MGVIQHDSKLFWLGDMELYEPRSKSGGNDYCRSPTLGSRTPSLMRKSTSSRRSRLNPSNDTDYNCVYSNSDERAGSRTDLSVRRNGINVNADTTTCNSNSQVGLNKEMALSAVMLSGTGGGIGMRKGSSRNLWESDCEQGNASTYQTGDSYGNGSISPVSSKCTCDRLRSKETVMINVGGYVFETYKATLRRLKSCKLGDEEEMMKYYRPEKGDYFFDRDPYAFNIILNYLRYGDLHLPTNLCGPALMREFQYWGIDEQDIERCCFQPYNTWKTQTKSLEKLEYDRKQSTTQTDLAHDRTSTSWWRRLRSLIWPFLQDPGSSRAAKIYAWISIIFVCSSIFSFCAETHPTFQVPPAEVHNLHVLYKLFALEDSKVFASIKLREEQNARLAVNTTVPNSTDNTPVNDTELGPDQTVQHPALLLIDLICVLFFSLEFLTRLIFCPKKLRFCTSLQNIIDFIAIVPDYVEFALLAVSPQMQSGLSFVDFIFILRMLRLCRIFRLIRHVPGLWILLYTLKASFNELLLMFVFLLIGMVMFASLLHFTEGGEKFSNIPVGFWWAVVTMTTVGYGDMYPVTAFGYFIGSICAISGLLMIAFTVPIIVSNFVLYYTHVQYGISDKDDESRGIDDIQEEVETCSFHTSYTETALDCAKGQSPDRNSDKTGNDSQETEFNRALSLTPSNADTLDKEEIIPMQTTNNNSDSK